MTDGNEAERPEFSGPATGGADTLLEEMLSSTYQDLGTAVGDRLAARGGPPELCDPDLALDRLLASVHRQTRVAIDNRLSAGHAERKNSLDALAKRKFPYQELRDRPADLRLKHRQKALTLVELFRAPNRTHTLRSAVSYLEELHGLLELSGEREFAEELMGKVVHRLDAIPRPYVSPSTARPGDGYEDAVRAHLDAPARRLAHRLQGIRRLLHEVVASYLPGDGGRTAESLGGATETVQDLCNDVERALEEAVALEAAIEAVVSASNDFCGADLNSAALEGVSLTGIIWNLDTVWPAGWEERILRTSLPRNEAETELVVAAEPSAQSMHADV
ncbi:hypothetical protein [Streptomyces smyrnaeus]|uniref:hypothetical protein n=1 Tax=Streptomyces smyrnaeus TaxID=1387713 RepID=UPI0033F77AA4